LALGLCLWNWGFVRRFGNILQLAIPYQFLPSNIDADR